MASQFSAHVTTLNSAITQCDPNPAYGLTVLTHTQTSETEAGDIVGQTGSSSVSVNCQFQRTPAGEVHTVDVNELHHEYDYASLPEPPEPQADYLTPQVPALSPSSYQVPVGNIPDLGAPHKPDYPSAHSFIVLAVTVALTCAIFNPLSLIFGIPAITLAILTLKYKYKNEDYPKAKNYGRCAFIFSFVTVSFTLFCIILIVASITGVIANCRFIMITRNTDPQCSN